MADNNPIIEDIQDNNQDNLKIDKDKVSAISKKVINSIFSRCGVAIADITIAEPIAFNASVYYNLNWSFKCRCSDKVLRNVCDDTHVLTTVGLDEYTQANTKELEKENSDKTKLFIDKLNSSSFKELYDLSGQIVCFNRLSAIGRTRCKTCHGTNQVPCEICGGKGRVTCPACHGSGADCQVCHSNGTVKCAHCNGTGHVKCKDCQSKGEQIVEREIIYDASCKKDIVIRLEVPGSNVKYTTFSKADEKTLLKAAHFENNNSGHEITHGYIATFSGQAPCYLIRVTVKNIKDPLDFILCGEDLKAICKPPVLDYVFQDEARLLSETLITAPDDVEEKVKCVKALGSKAIIVRTMRGIEGHEVEILKNEAVKNGITVESILNSTKGENHKAFSLKVASNIKILEAVTNELITNCQGFISEDFARNFSKNLISFVPMLMRLNPNSKLIWSTVTLITWLVMICFLYVANRPLAILFVFIFSSLICLFTSFALTKNWSYYSAVSMLKLTHKMKKVPSLTQEAVQSAKLMVGISIICVIAFVMMNGFLT